MKSSAAAVEGRRGPLNFIDRVYRTTAIVSLIVAFAVSGYFGWASAASYVVGALLGIGLMYVLARTVDLSIRRAARAAPQPVQRSGSGDTGGKPPVPHRPSAGAVIVGLNALKYTVIAVGLYLLVAHSPIRLWFLLAGYGTIYVVIALKVVGRMMIRSSGECAGAPTTDASGESPRGP